ncbi:MAG TPA: sigma-70 family RNA polymerase sigma factor [Chitinophagaceae bacterium]|nr:sigma-70 family RNA polymerase sigma factor [Chitinophagaceae bacterium]
MTASTKEFWEKAYQSNIGKLIGICYRYTRNYQLSEDLAHDAFLKAIDKSGTFKGKGKFEAWLRRIVVNHTLQYLRDRKKDPYVEDLMPDLVTPELIEENIHPIKSMSFTTAELIDIIDQLPEHHRLVFNLYVLEKFTHAQIGEELGVSEGTSKSHLARARKKLQQLLIQKAEENRNEKEHKKALVLLLARDADENMDQMIREWFDNFSIPPQHPLSLESIQFSNQNTFRGSSFLKSNVNILATSAIISIILVTVLVVSQMEKPAQRTPMAEKTGLDAAEKNPAPFQSQTATISQDSVIVKRNLKQKPMKPLDSLALMLVLSSSPLNAVTAKDSIQNEIEKYSHVEAKLLTDSAIDKSSLNFVNTPNTMKKGRGTFRASELYWSEENKELYFKGQVRVDFKDQHFQGNGSFTFLGKVQLLIVDGQPVTMGKTLKLANEDYELVTLNSKKATEKYGDKGLYGAVEISRTL